jgi:cyclomaltodextrinase / maltogenic alpha-amylase / neopullulanase
MKFKTILNLLSMVAVLFIFQSCLNINKTENPPHHSEWSYNATIYEVNVRQFSSEGTFNAVTKQIPRLKEMGIDILWLMPIHPIGELNRKGTYGSYYAVKDFKGVNPEFGTINDFNRLVKEAHNNNMRVIIDWVANHTAWDNVWTASKPEFFTLNKEGKFTPPVEDWSDVIDLNYDNKELWNYMYDAMAYWVNESDIDGFRCDVASMVPLDFWKWVRPKLEESKPLFMLAEGYEPELHEAFNMTYSWQLKDVFVEYAKGGKTTDIL